MSAYNYIATAQNPTAVSHSCVGNFTGPEDHNLIIGKCTHIEVYIVTDGRPQILIDVPIYGNISTLELFRPRGETQDLLLIATQESKFSVLRWDPDAKEIVIREICDTSTTLDDTTTDSSNGDTDMDTDMSDPWDPPAFGQAVIIDPRCKVIVLHTCEKNIKVVPLEDNGKLKEPFNIRLECIRDMEVLDMKFLYGCKKPTLAVLFSRSTLLCLNLGNKANPRQVQTYELSVEDEKCVQGPFTDGHWDVEADLLIPVPATHCGVLVIGGATIHYFSPSRHISIEAEPHISRCYKIREAGLAVPFDPVDFTKEWIENFFLAHGWVNEDGRRLLLGDHEGRLWSLIIKCRKKSILGLELQLLEKTFRASTISHLDGGLIYVGSRYGDSRLIQLNNQPHTAALDTVKVLESYTNLGPIHDFCVYERQGQVALLTCSGSGQAGSLGIVSKNTQMKIKINKLESADLQGIKGLWSLRVGTDDPFVVVSFVNESVILATSVTVKEGQHEHEYTLENKKIEGFNSEQQTLFCNDAMNDQIVQVTSNSVRLLSLKSERLVHEWHPPTDCCITVATANANQVVLSTSSCRLYYLQIYDELLFESDYITLQHEVSSLHIRPRSGKDLYGDMVAVGTWRDVSVKIFSLPELDLITERDFSPDSIRLNSVLFCVLEEICYLLCTRGDGYLSEFLLNTSTSTGKLELIQMKEVLVGTLALKLKIFSHKNTPHIFVASDRPKVVYSSEKRLHYSSVNLGAVRDVCQYSSLAFPDSLVYIEEERLTAGTTAEDVQRLDVRSIKFYENLWSIAHQKNSNTCATCSSSFIHLLDDQTCETLDTYQLADGEEFGHSLISCSFSDDEDEYYCVGTDMGRVLVFVVKDSTLEIVDDGRHTDFGIGSLSVYDGRLFAVSSAKKLLLMKWALGMRKLRIQKEYDLPGKDHGLEINGDYIMVYGNDIGLLTYQHEEEDLKQVASQEEQIRLACMFDNIYLGATRDNRLVTIDRESLVDEKVNRFRQGSLALQSGVGKTPVIIYGTEGGTIGMVASLPKEQFAFMERLENSMRKAAEGVCGFSDKKWRSRQKRDTTRRNFLDGDLLKLFLDLDENTTHVIAEMMGYPVEDLRRRVEDLKRLY